ncbi:acetyl/propionyl/methylcrotonyl-CoA carboxylase subunit alpha [Naumannella halotolerans]|uniref:acetyl/propionyl/methylcrotonyl-CoA carboxylase subunit alpha n=1 Tax=Naumannella halotolerans TaxID=993414 RepID=UPI00370D9DD1
MKRVLIANRGEIAVRIIRACADLGLTSIAVYADPDADALHTRLADEAYALPGGSSAETYLNLDAIIDVAKRAEVDAVHPGYGFLSENADFARAVTEAGLTWVGPPAEAIEALGDKVSARRTAQQVGAPLVAGTPGPIDSAEQAQVFAAEHGLPIAIKASFGGGGRGMRVVWRAEEIAEQYAAAVREAEQAFGRGECFVERYLEKPRHVEVQVLADTHGTVLALGTRDCSLQRRNQKLVEEAPAPFLTEEQTEQLLTSAAAVCAEAGYVGAGTVEYLLAVDGTISFLEVNTRLQVEHPVTEETTDLDLVCWQLRIADGERLDPSLSEHPVRGHAFEFRINAEDPGRGYLPSPGTITTLELPTGPGVRVDSGVVAGSDIPAAFDSMFAKLIIWGPDRATALARSRRALAEFVVEGVATVLPFDRAVVEDPDFIGDDGFAVHTRWIETEFAQRFEPAPAPGPADAVVTRTWIELDGRRMELGLPAGLSLGSAAAAQAQTQAAVDHGAIVADVPGTLGQWLVEDGATVSQGDPVAVLEAMKMESQVVSPADGTLSQSIGVGDSVAPGDVLGTVSD